MLEIMSCCVRVPTLVARLRLVLQNTSRMWRGPMYPVQNFSVRLLVMLLLNVSLVVFYSFSVCANVVYVRARYASLLALSISSSGHCNRHSLRAF